MIDVVFVILHYKTINDTKECVQSILENLESQNYHIIIVDNASPNKSFQVLNENYGNFNNITLLHNHDNLGFAKGNNVGYQYAKEKLNPAFIIMINNDTKMIQRDLIHMIKESYDNIKFAVMGPMILTADGRYDSNPVRTKLITKEEVDKVIHHYKKELLYLKLHVLWMQNLYHFLKSFLKKKKSKPIDFITMQKNVELHGCCFIFSEEYIKNYDGLDDRTFMYEEERILFKHMDVDGKIMLYNPNIIIFHKEGAATKTVNRKSNEQKKFLWKNSLDSAYVLKSLFNG